MAYAQGGLPFAIKLWCDWCKGEAYKAVGMRSGSFKVYRGGEDNACADDLQEKPAKWRRGCGRVTSHTRSNRLYCFVYGQA